MSLSPGSTLPMHNINASTDLTKQLLIVTIETCDTDPFLHAGAKIYTITLLVVGWHLGFTLKICECHNMSYIVHTNASSQI